MSNLTVKGIFEREDVKGKIQEMLGAKATGFITSVLQISANNHLLAKADPLTVYNSAMIAASLDLPINQNLGFAWIVPYKGQAQFQMGWKGYVQLAQRTGQYNKINVIKVYENQFKSFNSLSETIDADFNLSPDGAVVGYCAYFKLINGYEKTVFWTRQQVEDHAKRFSQSFNQSFSPWKSDFDAMAMKTVLKHTLSKWGILSIEMQKANNSDQAVVVDHETESVEYVDFGTVKPLISEAELESAKAEIKAGNTTVENVQNLFDLTEDQLSNLNSIEDEKSK
jgi:recombination protein RecT